MVSYSRIGFEPCSARPTFLLPAAPAPALALGLVERIELSHNTAGCRCIAAISQHLDKRLLQAKRQARTRENRLLALPLGVMLRLAMQFTRASPGDTRATIRTDKWASRIVHVPGADAVALACPASTHRRRRRRHDPLMVLPRTSQCAQRPTLVHLHHRHHPPPRKQQRRRSGGRNNKPRQGGRRGR